MADDAYASRCSSELDEILFSPRCKVSRAELRNCHTSSALINTSSRPPPPEASTRFPKPLQLLCRDAKSIRRLELGPGAGRHSLPRSCWDLGAAVEAQPLQSRRFAQSLEKNCGAIDAFAVVAKAPGARWDRKNWTTKISIQSDTVATDSDIDPPKL